MRVSEYTQDRLKGRIEELEAEVEYQQKVIASHRDMEKDRIAGEAAIFVVGLLIGIAVGFYSA